MAAGFHELREDFEAAERELELELDTLPPEHHTRGYIEQQLARVRGLRSPS